MNIYAILDACDLHLVYIRPGVFATLCPKCRRRYEMQESPPEFPAWTADTMNQSIADDSSQSTIEGFKTSDLLQTFLNISQDGIMLDPNMKGGNIPMRPDMQGENAANTQMDTSSLQPVMQGGNTLNIQLDTTN